MKTLKTILVSFLFLSLFNCNAKANNTKNIEVLAINEHPKPKKSTIRVALLLDTSNSMDGLIDQAKAQLWKIVNELSYAKCEHETPNLKIALYEYGNDDIEERDQYIRKVIDFSSDLDEISERLFSLDTNGGSEYCGAVIKSSLTELKWGKNNNDLNMIFIAGNEAFTQGNVSYKEAITDALEKDVVVNTIFCGTYKNGVYGKWKDAASLGKGEYLTINHNKHIVHISTPYDDIIIQLNKKLNKTYISYGNHGYKKMSLQAQQDDNAYELAEEVVVNRAVSKSSKAYKNASWDLVDARKEKGFNIQKIDKSTLPKELKNKSTKEIKLYIDKKEKERTKIQNEIQKVNKQRLDYIAKHSSTHSKDELENVMIKAIKNQAKKKNYTF